LENRILLEKGLIQHPVGPIDSVTGVTSPFGQEPGSVPGHDPSEIPGIVSSTPNLEGSIIAPVPLQRLKKIPVEFKKKLEIPKFSKNECV